MRGGEHTPGAAARTLRTDAKSRFRSPNCRRVRRLLRFPLGMFPPEPSLSRTLTHYDIISLILRFVIQASLEGLTGDHTPWLLALKVATTRAHHKEPRWGQAHRVVRAPLESRP